MTARKMKIFYQGGDDKLDECIGGTYNGKYIYFITDNYPTYHLCLSGDVSSDFNKRSH